MHFGNGPHVIELLPKDVESMQEPLVPVHVEPYVS